MTRVTDPQQQLSFRSTPRMRAQKSPDEGKPAGVNVSGVGLVCVIWWQMWPERVEYVALDR